MVGIVWHHYIPNSYTHLHFYKPIKFYKYNKREIKKLNVIKTARELCPGSHNSTTEVCCPAILQNALYIEILS